MGEARHVGGEILFHDFQKGCQKLSQAFPYILNFKSGIKLHIKGHLVVPAAARVEFFARLTDSPGQNGLHKAVNIFIFFCNGKLPFLHVPADPGKPLRDGIPLLFREDSLLLQHDHMRHTAFYILCKQTSVKGDGCVEIIHQLIRLLCKSSAPQLSHADYLRF